MRIPEGYVGRVEVLPQHRSTIATLVATLFENEYDVFVTEDCEGVAVIFYYDEESRERRLQSN